MVGQTSSPHTRTGIESQNVIPCQMVMVMDHRSSFLPPPTLCYDTKQISSWSWSWSHWSFHFHLHLTLLKFLLVSRPTIPAASLICTAITQHPLLFWIMQVYIYIFSISMRLRTHFSWYITLTCQKIIFGPLKSGLTIIRLPTSTSRDSTFVVAWLVLLNPDPDWWDAGQ